MPDETRVDPSVGGAGGTALLELAGAMSALARRTESGRRGALTELVEAAVEHVPGARWASITSLDHGRFRTDASTARIAEDTDAIQYDVGSGPCVDAVLDDALFVTGDLGSDQRWPEFGARAVRETGVRSVLAYRLALHADSGVIAGLNLYSDAVDAMDGRSIATGLVLATHASLLVSAALDRDRADQLHRALRSNRDIGVAMGVLMQRHALTRDQSFDVLRVASQDSNRKLSEVAAEVAETGTLVIDRWPGRHPRTSGG